MKVNILKTDFVGLDTRYPLASGKTARRIYLDSSASTLMLRPALEATQAYLSHYANTHTSVHTSAKITSALMHWARKKTLGFVNASAEQYLCTFIGSGTTAATNRLAAGLAMLRPERDVVLVSTMEHHSNDLPHRQHTKQFKHIPLEGDDTRKGQVDLAALETLLQQNNGRVNYIAVTGVSNVTGILNPLKEIAELAHRHDAYFLVDGAQMAAHAPIDITATDIDFFVFSGHKVYAPGSPGILIGRRDLIQAMPANEVGGGMVSAVTKWGYEVADDLGDREQAGTPNIPGIITLACALESLRRVGMQHIYEHEQQLVAWATEQLKQCRTITVYGDIQHPHRVGSIAFNLNEIGHGLTAAILNDYHGIAVRNECFCAHPYVQEMLQPEFLNLDIEGLSNEEVAAKLQDRRGMVRASFGLYTTREDILALVAALKDIEENIDHYRNLYDNHPDGSYEHREFKPAPETLFDIENILNGRLKGY